MLFCGGQTRFSLIVIAISAALDQNNQLQNGCFFAPRIVQIASSSRPTFFGSSASPCLVKSFQVFRQRLFFLAQVFATVLPRAAFFVSRFALFRFAKSK